MRWSRLCDATAGADPFHGIKHEIGVVGSCNEAISEYAREKARGLGEAIGRTGYVSARGTKVSLPVMAHVSRR